MTLLAWRLSVTLLAWRLSVTLLAGRLSLTLLAGRLSLTLLAGRHWCLDPQDQWNDCRATLVQRTVLQTPPRHIALSRYVSPGTHRPLSL